MIGAMQYTNEQEVYRLYLCGGPRCSLHNLVELHCTFDLAVWEHELCDQVEIYIGTCLGRCDHAPNVMVFPGSYRYTHLDRAAIQRIVERHLLHDEPVTELLDTPDHCRICHTMT